MKKFADDYNDNYKNLDILINNAGIYNVDLKYSKQGIEQNF